MILLYYFILCYCVFFFFFFKQKTAYEMRISDWSSDVCSSDLHSAFESPLASTAVAPGDCVFHAENEGRRHAPRRHFAPPVYRFHCGGPVSWILVSADAPKSAASEQQQQEYDDEHAAEIGRESCRERVCQYV